MRRYRNRNSDVGGAIGSIIGMLILLAFVAPKVRLVLLAFGVVAAIALIAVAAWTIHRRIKQRKSPPIIERNVDWSELNVSTQEHHEAKADPLTTTAFIQQLRSIDWYQFEKIVAHMYARLGFAVSKVAGANPDGGIDLIIERDGLRTAVQCKHWKSWNVGVSAIREFLGALTDSGIPRGIFITLRGYTADAKHLAEKHGIEILNGLANLFETTDAQFDPVTLVLLNAQSKHCPRCKAVMKIRHAKRGRFAGQPFWGCSRHPHCRYILPV